MNFLKIVLSALTLSFLGACAGNLSIGARYHNQGDYEKAIEYFSKALSDKSNSYEYPPHVIYNIRGISYFKNSQYDQAIADYSKAISLKPDYAEAHHNRGLAYEYQQEYDQALSNFDEAINLNPEFSHAYVSRGSLFETLGRNDQAIAEYDRAIALDPNNVTAYISRGQFYWNIKQYDLALKNFDSAIARNPLGYSPYIQRGYANFYLGRNIEAANDFENSAINEEDVTLSIYATIWRYLALERQGKNGKTILKEISRGFDLQEWPGLLISLYLGGISPREVIDKSEDNDKTLESLKKCFAYFHLGQFYLLQEKKSLAIDMFRKTASFEDCPLIELPAALEELERMRLLPT
ncbi:MAG: hypothetical protein NPINA01_28840 [Nitrospinaceae bacterium]|nr:MAG: hypothetical protein NPINA01_28840 [Nitrospinaceae bacterium]